MTKYPKFCKDCRWSEPDPKSPWLLKCKNLLVNSNDPYSLGSPDFSGKPCHDERKGGFWSACGKRGKQFEYDRGQVWTTQATATPAVTSVGASTAVNMGLTYWNAGCTDPDNCMLCKAAKLPGSILTNLYHAGIPTVKRDG